MPEYQTHPLSFAPLPDLCRLPVVLAVLLVGQLMVITYVLSLGAIDAFDWEMLSLLTLYVQWIDLLALAVLCQIRQLYIQRSLATSSHENVDYQVSAVALYTWSFIAIIGVVALSNTAAQWLYLSYRSAWSPQWLIRDLIIALVLGGIVLRYLYLQQQSRAEQLAADRARFDALQARMRPHFLFNTMNTIASLISYAPADAESAVEDLSELLRATLSDRRRLVPWEHELTICKAYLRIEQLRLGERLKVEWNIDANVSRFQLPPLSLQPLIENAIYHGIETRPEGGCIEIVLRDLGEQVALQLSNPVFSKVPKSVDLDQSKPHNGIALNNLRARLATLFKDDNGQHLAALDTQVERERFTVTMRLPKENKSSNLGAEHLAVTE